MPPVVTPDTVGRAGMPAAEVVSGGEVLAMTPGTVARVGCQLQGL